MKMCTATRRPAKTLNNYRRRRVPLLPLPSPREQLLPTTTREQLLPLHRFEPVPLQNSCFEGITRDDRDEMPLHV